MKRLLLGIFGMVFLIGLVYATSVGTDDSDFTRGKVVYTPPTPTGAAIVCADCNLDDLGDVNAGTPNDDEVLTWDDGTSKWIAKAVAAISKWIINPVSLYLYNDSDTLYFNEAQLNITIDARIPPDTNVTTECGDGNYLDGDGVCYHFNDSVKILFSEEQVVYNASVIVTEVGTLDAGDLNSIKQLADGDTYNVSEVSGTPGFLININFTNVVNFNTVAIRGMYDGGAGHTVALELYRVGVGWEERHELTDQSDFGVTTFDVFIGSDFIDEYGTVQFKINHDDPGNINHNYFLDAAFIGQVTGLVSGGDLADLTGRDEACDLLPDVLCKDGSKALTGNWNYGTFNFNGSGDFTTTSIGTFDSVKVYDGIDKKHLELAADSASLGADDRYLAFNVGDDDRTLYLEGDATLDDWFDQSVKKEANVTHHNLSLTGDLNVAGTAQLGNTTIGSGEAGMDYSLNFDGEDNDCVIFWDEDVDSLKIDNSFWIVLPDGHTRNPFRMYEGGIGGTMRTSLELAGTQKWYIRAGATEKGNLAYTTPGGNIGIVMVNAAGTGRTEIVAYQAGGFYFKTSTTSGAGDTNLELLPGGIVKMPGVYDDDIGTERELLIQADGQLGYDGSSIEYKEKVEDLTQIDIDKILQLRPVTYDKIDGSETHQYGFIAEEVNELFPEFVSYKRNIIYKEVCGWEMGNYTCWDEVDKIEVTDIPETINYRKMSVLAIELAQKVQQENQVLKLQMQEVCKLDISKILSWCK